MRARHRKTQLHLAYVRVSTEDQANEGVSLAAQEERVRAYAVATDRPLAEVIVDAGVSAKTLNRPGLQRLLAMVRRGEVASVTIVKLDRITRSVRDLADLVETFAKHGCALVSVSESLDTGTAAGRLLLNLLGSVAQWEREAVGERTGFALAHKRRQGQVYGTVPFGFVREGDLLVVDEAEQAILGLIRDLREQGLSYARIASTLCEQGYRTRCGGRWFAASVHSVLTSAMQVAA